MLIIKENQDSLRISLEHRITNLKSKLTQEIQRHVKSLKDEMTLEFAHVDNKIKELQTKMSKYESSHNTDSLPSVTNEDNSQHKLVFKNIKLKNNDQESLKAYVNCIIHSIGLYFNVVDAQQIGLNNGAATKVNPTRTKPVIVSFQEGKHRVDVLKNKRKLKDIDDFKNIYIEPDRSCQERLQEANFRRLAKSIPNLQFRNGRVIEKQN
ncbi:unnamed protein product [Mytilus coruscus]|uniref:Uncharacterized protein n=1 Tax=Mytilus coruscus TaxID=42192 RepID=A0A6J8CU71_MYTCO|nr:unnamed protein product [Mytilus coruscus]